MSNNDKFSDYRRFQSIPPSTVQINCFGEVVGGTAPENGRVPDTAPRKSESTPKQIDNPITDNGVLLELIDSEHGIISKDRSSNYNVAEMKESSRKGLEGKGTSEKTFAESMSDLDQGGNIEG